MKSIIVIIMLGVSLMLISISESNLVYGQLNHRVLGDVYVDSDEPTQIPWNLSVFEESDTFYCDKTTQSIFKLGKTTVRCVDTDQSGNEVRTFFIVTIGYKVVQIPNWFKQPTQFWINGQISDNEYYSAIETMLQNGYMSIPHTKTSNSTQNIPVWIYDNSQNWVDGKISDDEFSIGIQWMIQNGLITNS